MKNTQFLFVIIIMVLYTACVPKKQKENTITISGAFALYPLVIKWAEEYKKENPQIRFNISGGGAGKGMADALSGSVDLGMFSRNVSEEETRKGAWWVGVSIDAVIPTISSQNPCADILKKRGLTRQEFRAIFIDGTIMNWNVLVKESSASIKVYTRADACGAAETWANYLGGKHESIKGIGIFGDPGLAEAVAKDADGIAYNNTVFVYDPNTGQKRPGLEIVPIDINGNGKIDAEEDFYDSYANILEAIKKGIFPSPPARELYFVSKGKPGKQAALEFIKWTLTSGQRFVTEAGYVPLHSNAINQYVEKTK